MIRVVGSNRLRRWDVKQWATLSWELERRELTQLGSILQRRVVTADPSTRLGSIHFDGRVSVRSGDRSLKGRSFSARGGDLVFSKIDARNGAIAVVPPELDTLAFSSEYPIYSVIDPAVTSESFLALLCRSETFLSQLRALSVGHSGRKRVSPAEFEKMLVPLPRRDEQDRIVAEFARANNVVTDEISARREGFEEAQRDILSDLGIAAPSTVVRSGILVARSNAMRSWSASVVSG